MTTIITNAVRAGCNAANGDTACLYPACGCAGTTVKYTAAQLRLAVDAAARHAAEAMREEAADKCEAQARGLLNVRGRTNQVDRHTASVLQGRATAIRAIPIEGETK